MLFLFFFLTFFFQVMDLKTSDLAEVGEDEQKLFEQLKKRVHNALSNHIPRIDCLTAKRSDNPGEGDDSTGDRKEEKDGGASAIADRTTAQEEESDRVSSAGEDGLQSDRRSPHPKHQTPYIKRMDRSEESKL